MNISVPRQVVAGKRFTLVFSHVQERYAASMILDQVVVLFRYLSAFRHARGTRSMSFLSIFISIMQRKRFPETLTHRSSISDRGGGVNAFVFNLTRLTLSSLILPTGPFIRRRPGCRDAR